MNAEKALKPVLSHSRKVKLPSLFHIYTNWCLQRAYENEKYFRRARYNFYRNFLAEPRGNFSIHEDYTSVLFLISISPPHPRDTQDVCLFMLKLRYNFRFLLRLKEKWGFIVSSWLGIACKKFFLFSIFYQNSMTQFSGTSNKIALNFFLYKSAKKKSFPAV
jgi:hypothetical protein